MILLVLAYLAISLLTAMLLGRVVTSHYRRAGIKADDTDAGFSLFFGLLWPGTLPVMAVTYLIDWLANAARGLRMPAGLRRLILGGGE